MAVINEFGASATSLDQYIAQIRAAYLDIDPGWNIEPESPDGLAIAVWAELFANLDEAVLNALRAVDPASAVGQQLNRLGAVSGITRQPATASTATVIFTGTNGTAVPMGTLVRNIQTDTLWATDGIVTISGGTATVGVTCQTPGSEPAGVGALSSIYTPVGGVQSVTNPSTASLGRDEEKDALFRVRRDQSVAMPSNNQLDSIAAAVANVEGVKRRVVYENFEGSADANGLDPHSMLIVVDGGSDADVAAAIASRKNPGTGMNATNSYDNKVQVATTTPGGNPLTVTFYRPELVTIYIAVTVGGSLYPGADDDIKSAIVAYANGELFDAEGAGFDRTGFDIGDVIAAGKLFTPVNRVVADSGYAVSIKIGTSIGSINLDTVDPGFNGLGVFDASNITVAVV